MSLIDKVCALWRSLFGRRTQPALARGWGRRECRRAPKPAATASAADAAAGMYLV